MSNQLRIAKLGENALTSTDPRDFVFHSGYNTLNILNEATHAPTLATNGSEGFANKAHGMGFTPFTIGFCKFSNSRVAPPGTRASNANFWFTNLRVNASNVRFGYYNNSGSNYTPTFKYMQTELPLAGTPSVTLPSGNVLRIAKTGYNALTETNPNNISFDSRYKSVKYFVENSIAINVPNANSYELVINTHNLGYYPLFTASAVFATASTTNYIMPITFADAGFEAYDFIYSTTTQLIYRSERSHPAGGYTITLYYKIYSYDLGL